MILMIMSVYKWSVWIDKISIKSSIKSDPKYSNHNHKKVTFFKAQTRKKKKKSFSLWNSLQGIKVSN